MADLGLQEEGKVLIPGPEDSDDEDLERILQGANEEEEEKEDLKPPGKVDEKEEKKTEEKKEEKKEEDEIEGVSSEQELQELRRLAREQKRELVELKAQAEASAKALEKAGLTEPPSEEEVKAMEAAQAAVTMKLEVLLEAMELNSKYEDVREVVSQDNFDDLVEMMAKYVVNTEGGKLQDRVNDITKAVWNLPNPYKYMYEKIKEFHPKFVKTKEKEEDKEKKGEDKKEGSSSIPPSKLPPKAPGTINDIPGGGGTNKGWTAETIDNLEEAELHKVPRDIYEKYLRNELP